MLRHGIDLLRRIQHKLSGHDPDEGIITLPELPKARLWSPEKIAQRSWLQPLNTPMWRPARLADHMRPDDPILGLYLNRQAWALPWWILKNHHVANLTVKEHPVLITLCEVCTSGTAFAPVVQGRRLSFGLAGAYNGTHCLVDREYGSIWTSFTGEALTGPLKGQTLTHLPLSQCLWREWLEQHPTTQVLYSRQDLRSGHGSKRSPGSPERNHPFWKTLLRPIDKRLPFNTLVLGVQSEEQARAYPISVLDRGGAVLNDRLGQQDLVILHRPKTLQALAFARQVNSRVLDFDQTVQGTIIDRNTGSSWNLAGEATAGPLAGQSLIFAASWVEEWFAWAAYHPQSEIFSGK